MNVLCWLFGHKSCGQFYNGRQYMRIRDVVEDGTGRKHATLDAECPRCMTVYRAGMVHLPSGEK